MTQQLGDGRIDYLQARSAHDAEPSLSAEQAEDVSGALAFTAGAHSDRRFASVFVTGADGLKLHVRSYGSRVASALPVVRLPGLARTAADFHPLEVALAADPLGPYRSRGSGSRWADELWEQYSGHVSSGRRLHRSNPQGCKARRPAGLAIHQIRVRHQHANGQGARPRSAQLCAT